MMQKIALATVLSLFVMQVGYIRYFQLYSGDRQGTGTKIQMATGTPAASKLVAFDANNNAVASSVPASVQGDGTKVQLASGTPVSGNFVKFDANGNVVDSGIPATSQSGVPSGIVAYFAADSCPSGWSVYTAGLGRYVVGMHNGGTAGTVVGTALSYAENRDVAEHTHTLSDPGHYHSLGTGVSYVTTSGTQLKMISNSDENYSLATASTLPANTSAYTGITLGTTGTISGTTAPYVLLKPCRKD